MNDHLTDAYARARATRDAAVRDFGTLDRAALNWKPAPDRWSVAQCLEHLVLANRAYWPTFEAVAEGRKEATLFERIPLVPRLFGSLMRRAVTPEARMRVRTTNPLEPASSDLPETIVADFAANVDEHLAKIAATEGVDHRRVVVTSPIASFVVYSLEVAVLVSVAHLERHRLQAVRVTELEGFPGAD